MPLIAFANNVQPKNVLDTKELAQYVISIALFNVGEFTWVVHHN